MYYASLQTDQAKQRIKHITLIISNLGTLTRKILTEQFFVVFFYFRDYMVSCYTVPSSHLFKKKDKKIRFFFLHVKKMTSNRLVITQEGNMVHHYTKVHIYQKQ